MYVFFLPWMWENMKKASRDWTNQKEQSQEELVLEESLCFWRRWQCGQRCVVVVTVSREGAADGKLPEMHRMTLTCRGPIEEGYPWNKTCCALWMWAALGLLSVALEDGIVMQWIWVKAAHSSVGLRSFLATCTVAYEATTMEHGISSPLGRLSPENT